MAPFKSTMCLSWNNDEFKQPGPVLSRGKRGPGTGPQNCRGLKIVLRNYSRYIKVRGKLLAYTSVHIISYIHTLSYSFCNMYATICDASRTGCGNRNRRLYVCRARFEEE